MNASVVVNSWRACCCEGVAQGRVKRGGSFLFATQTCRKKKTSVHHRSQSLLYKRLHTAHIFLSFLRIQVAQIASVALQAHVVKKTSVHSQTPRRTFQASGTLHNVIHHLRIHQSWQGQSELISCSDVIPQDALDLHIFFSISPFGGEEPPLPSLQFHMALMCKFLLCA